MKILIIHQYFNAPHLGGPLRSYYLARGLKSDGHQVEIITAHNQKKEATVMLEGIRVHYLPVYYDNRLGFQRRILAFLKFAWLAYYKAFSLEGINLCYAISTPLTVGWVARRLRHRKGIPYIFEVGDLWPEAPVQMGVIRNPWIIDRLRRFEKSIYQKAYKLVALSPGIRSGILRIAPDSEVITVPNMADCQFFDFKPKDSRLESKFEVRGKLVVTYFGAAGKANHLDYLVEAARFASEVDHRLHFLIMASGSELERLKKQAKKHSLQNLDFLEYRNRAGLREVLNVTDVVYVSYADVPILTTGSPNKFFDGLAAGKLMVVNFSGWLKDITEQHQIGFYVNPQKPQMLAELLSPLVTDRQALQLAQSNARLLAETIFSRSLSIKKILNTLKPEEPSTIKAPGVYNLTA